MCFLIRIAKNMRAMSDSKWWIHPDAERPKTGAWKARASEKCHFESSRHIYMRQQKSGARKESSEIYTLTRMAGKVMGAIPSPRSRPIIAPRQNNEQIGSRWRWKTGMDTSRGDATRILLAVWNVRDIGNLDKKVYWRRKVANRSKRQW